MNDGVIATTGLVAGLTFGDAGHPTIVVASMAAVWAAMVSMGIGSYLATRAEVTWQQALVARERWELTDHPDEELEEMRQIYQEYGFSTAEVETILGRLRRDPELWLKLMLRDELGVLPERWESALTNALIMAFAVLCGSLPPLIPYVLMSRPYTAFWPAIALAGVTSWALGAMTAAMTGQSRFRVALKFVLLALLAVVLGSTMGGVIANWIVS